MDRQVRSIGNEVSLVQIEVAKNSIGITEQLDTSLKNAFEAAASISEAETVEVILRKRSMRRAVSDSHSLSRNSLVFSLNSQIEIKFIDSR